MEPTEPSHVSPQVSEVLDKARYRRFNWGLTAIYIAIVMGLTEDVEILIDRGENYTFDNMYNKPTALHIAAERGYPSIVLLLINKGIDINIKDEDKATPLHYAARSGFKNTVAMLVNNGADVNATCRSVDKYEKLTALHFAVENDHPDVVRLLIDKGIDINIKDENGKSPLHYAAKSGSEDTIALLVNNGADVNAVDKNNRVPLHFAARSGSENTVAILLNNGANVNALDKCNNSTALHFAAERGYLDIVQLLIDKGIDVNTKDYDQETPLLYAARGDFKSIVTMLVKSGANVNAIDKYQRSPLHYTARNGSENAVTILVNNKADVNAIDEDQTTPLHFATRNGSEDTVAILDLIVNNGADVNAKDKDQKTALHYAASSNFENAVTILVHKGADVNAMDEDLKTALHYAARGGFANTVTILVNNGADVNVIDEDGNTPLHIACQCSMVCIVSYFLSLTVIDPVAKNHKMQTPIEVIPPYSEYRTIILQSFWDFDSCRRNYPIESYTKVFICGNAAVGKSSLTKILKIRSEKNSGIQRNPQDTVTGVTLQTAGIEPHTVTSHEVGNIILYDFAGHPEYYSSHAAVLENLMLHSPAVFAIVVNLTSSNESIENEIYYWLNFIESACVGLSKPSEVLVVGSHVDKISSIDAHCGHLIEDIVKNSIQKQHWNGFIQAECHRPEGIGILDLMHMLAKCCNECYRASDSISYYCHVLFSFLSDLKTVAISVKDLIIKLKENNHPSLPSDPTIVTQLLTTLSDKGLILYLPSSSNSDWVIIDRSSLLTEINGILFAPEAFEWVHQKIASNTGIIPLSSLANTFPNYDPKMLTGFLVSLKFCNIFKANVLNQMKTNISPLVSNDVSSDDLLFFPSLVNINCPSSISFDPQFGWCLWCPNPCQFLSTRFLHVLLLRLSLNYLTNDLAGKIDTNPAQQYQSRCTVWKNGISWSDKGIKVLLEVSDNNRCVTFFLSQKDGKKALKLCSYILNEIRCLKNSLCPCKSMEYIIAPIDLTLEVRLQSVSERCLIPLSSVAEALLSEEDVLYMYNKQEEKEFKTTSIISDCEPYSKLKPEVVIKIFDGETAALPENQILQVLLSCPYIECTLLSVQSLRDYINNFSLFTGLSPLDFITNPKLLQKLQSQTCSATPENILQSSTESNEAGSSAIWATETFLDITNLVNVMEALKQLKDNFPLMQWEDFGLELGISYNTLKIIEHDNNNKCDQCLRECLAFWLKRADNVMERGGPPTWKSLIDALRRLQINFQ